MPGGLLVKAAWFFLALSGAVLCESGCSAGGATSAPSDGLSGGGTSGLSGGNTGGSDPIFGNSGTANNGAGGGGIDPTIRNTPDGGCPRVTQKAEKQLGGKADIFWVLDNSGSMFDESQG